MIITIDGPSGTGKSTVARGLADALGMTYFDTGALYRAISWQVLQEEVAFRDQKELAALLESFTYHIKTIAGEKHYFVGNTDVTKAIRSSEVTAIVSEVSALKEVREVLKPLQIDFSKETNVVFEGRDLGTVVFPHADLKFFLTARPQVRAERRFEELKRKFPNKTFSLDKTLKDIQERDQLDSTREHAPLMQAEDAVLIDTSDLSIEEVIQKMKDIYQTRAEQ